MDHQINSSEDTIEIDSTSMEIITGFLEGDSNAISEVYTRFINQLTFKAEKHIPDKFKAKIVPVSIVNSVIQSFIEINEYKKQKYESYQIRSWDQLYGLLATMTMRKAMNRVRSLNTIKRSGDSATSEQLEIIESRTPSPQEEAEFGELMTKLLNDFSPLEYDILQARMSGQTVELIAHEKGYLAKSVKSTIKRLQRKLTKIIKTYGEN